MFGHTSTAHYFIYQMNFTIAFVLVLAAARSKRRFLDILQRLFKYSLVQPGDALCEESWKYVLTVAPGGLWAALLTYVPLYQLCALHDISGSTC